MRDEPPRRATLKLVTRRGDVIRSIPLEAADVACLIGALGHLLATAPPRPPEVRRAARLIELLEQLLPDRRP